MAMAITFLIACIASLAFAAQAAPIVFVNSNFDGIGVASADGIADIKSAASPPSATPIFYDASAGTFNFAQAGGVAAPGLLTASSLALSFVQTNLPSATAQTHFLGTFAASGSGKLVTLDLGAILNSQDTDGGAGTLIATVRNSSQANPIFDNFFTTDGNKNISFSLPSTGATTLELFLISESSATRIGQSVSDFSQVTINGAVPLPATPFLLFAALGALAAARRRPQGATEVRRRRLKQSRTPSENDRYGLSRLDRCYFLHSPKGSSC